jgi:hypothetical protein
MAVWEGVELPGFAASLVAVPPQRREALTAHLANVLAAAEHVAAEPPVANDMPLRSGEIDRAAACRAAAACAACRGYCCRNGCDSAYLDAKAIAGISGSLPHLARDELLAAYAGAVPQMSYEGSCIFHTAQGCNLPRQMRSPVCLAYYCWPLKERLAST